MTSTACLLALLLPAACDPKDQCISDCDAATGGTSDDPEPSGGPDSATEGATDNDTDSGGDPSGDASTGTSTGASETVGGPSTGTGSPASCDLNEWVCDAVEGGTVPAEEIVDCGTVVVEDEASAWVDMHDCVLEAAASQRAYKGFVHRINGLREAFGSVVGAQYSPQHWILTDSGRVFMERCSEPTALPDCDPSPATGTCLVCFGEGNQVCPAD